MIGEPEPANDRYFGHESKVQLPVDLCLLGCVFYLIEHETGPLKINDQMLQTLLKNVIKMGGQFQRAYGPAVTHILCETQQNALVQKAMQEGKRCVTVFWLNEVLEERKMRPPFRLWHLPRIFPSSQAPCADKVGFFFRKIFK